MSWTRLDDLWTEKIALTGIGFEARWHYLALIQFCSRTERWDGTIPRRQSLRVSDVEDPEAANHALHQVELINYVGTDSVRVVHIDNHIPPEYMRDPNRKAQQNERKKRQRLHEKGDHSTCLPENCPDAHVTSRVTRDTGTGQDRPQLRKVTKSVTEPWSEKVREVPA